MAAVLILMGVAIWAMFYRPDASDNNKDDSGNVAASSICSKSVITEANVPLANSDQVALTPVVDKIKKLKGFDTDPNCLYVVLQYDLATGDAAASRNDLNKYEKVYDPVVGLSDAFTVSIIPLEALRENVAFLEQSAKDGEQNEQLNDKSAVDGSEAADKFYREHKQ